MSENLTWLRPLRIDGWRRLCYALISLPTAFVGLILAAVGATRTAARLHATAARVMRAHIPATADRPRLALVGRWLLAVPLAALTCVVAVVVIANTVRNLAYPLQPTRVTDWGGPTLAGRWTVHALGWLPFAYLGIWLVWGLTAIQQRLLASTSRAL